MPGGQGSVSPVTGQQVEGPNVRKLITRRMACYLIPAGQGLAAAIDAIRTPGKLAEAQREASRWVHAAITAVKACPDNPFPDDEAIAGDILARLNKRAPT